MPSPTGGAVQISTMKSEDGKIKDERRCLVLRTVAGKQKIGVSRMGEGKGEEASFSRKCLTEIKMVSHFPVFCKNYYNHRVNIFSLQIIPFRKPFQNLYYEG
ncbi:hypothetical protein V6Z12_D11G185200 [Gossypium hirsutum]